MTLDPVHFSRLKLMAQSPAHYAEVHRDQTRSISVGSVLHTLVLGGDLIVYDGERRGLDWLGFKAVVDGAEPFIFEGERKGKAWETAKREADGRPAISAELAEQALKVRAIQERRAREGKYLANIVTTAEKDAAQRMADSVLRHPIASHMLDGARTEVPLRWKFLDRDCAGTLDIINGSYGEDVIELKSARTTDPRWFVRDAMRHFYHAQLAWYGEGLTATQRHPAKGHFIIAVEVAPPHVVTVFKLTEQTIELGRRTFHGWMERLLTCEAVDRWPGYSQTIVDLDIEPELELTGFEEVEDG